jgi:hypothetical protein
MDIGIVFDWFTQESIHAALEATQWEQREYWLRLALLWGAAAHARRKNSASTPSADAAYFSIELIRGDARGRDGGVRQELAARKLTALAPQ